MSFLLSWEGENSGWGSRVTKVPNYSANMQRWRGRITQTRDRVILDDSDQALLTELDNSGTTKDSVFSLAGCLDGETYATLFTGVCKEWRWINGKLHLDLANRFEDLRSGRFVSNYIPLKHFDMSSVQVDSLSGTDVVLNQDGIIAQNQMVFWNDGLSDPVFLATNSILMFNSAADPSSLEDQWEFSIAGFPRQNESDLYGSAIAMRLEIETEVEAGWNIHTVEDQVFVADPLTLIREFLSGTCTDIGWTEGVEYEIGTTSILEQVELTIPITKRVNTDASVLSVLDHICEQTLISVYPDREGVVHFKPQVQVDLTAPSDGDMGTAWWKAGEYLESTDEVVTTIELFFGYNAGSGDVYETWGGQKTFKPPDFWPAYTDLDRTRTFEAKYIFHPDIAKAMSLRILARHFRGVPQLEIKALPTSATVQIGDVETIYWSLLDVDEDRYEVTSIRDDWDGGEITVTLQQGTTLYDQLGFGKWEDSDWEVTPDHAVTGTSTLGWGDGTLGETNIGTCNGINVDMYGTTWRWAG
jgi:hypothetical protein